MRAILALLKEPATCALSILAFIGACVVTCGLVWIATPTQLITTHDWIAFERGADGQLLRGAWTVGGTEGTGAHCWMAWGRPNERPEMEGVWYSPSGPIILPTTASRVRVLEGRWEETAAMLGINLQECR
jgi:hypothetical protein